jgi:hypothetical protein
MVEFPASGVVKCHPPFGCCFPSCRASRFHLSFPRSKNGNVETEKTAHASVVIPLGHMLTQNVCLCCRACEFVHLSFFNTSLSR